MFQDRTGQQVPDVTFRIRRGHEWADLSTDSIFKGRTVVVFSLPGAFTPTCSSSHVPRYNRMASAFKAAGVDEIVCISVNDSFVMNEWKREQKADRVTFIPDGNGEFTEGMGMLAPMDDLGFGKRSWRYSMLVRDGMIEKMFIEPVKPGDPFEVSDADTMLAWLAPAADAPRDVTVFTRPGCSFCQQAKAALSNAGLEYEELVLNRDYTDQTLRAVTGATSVPQVFVDGQLIGGADALDAWLASDEPVTEQAA